MKRLPIPVEKLRLQACLSWEEGLVLTAGDFAAKKYNAMAVGWGSVGVMWGMPFVQVVVRPGRYTHEFMEKYDTFTVAAFPRDLRGAVEILGTRSGRQGDKIAAAGLTATASTKVAAPSFAEADLVLECRKIYTDDFDPARFLDSRIEGNYPRKDYHRVWFGELLAVTGTAAYMA
ncbi:MAG: flavin reductase [Planctomycetota bacterium]